VGTVVDVHSHIAQAREKNKKQEHKKIATRENDGESEPKKLECERRRK